MLRLTTAHVAGSVVFGWFFANLSISKSRSAASWSNTCQALLRLTQRLHGTTGLGGGLLDGLLRLGGPGGGGEGVEAAPCQGTTLSGVIRCSRRLLSRQKGMRIAQNRETR